MSFYVLKRSGKQESVHFDKITKRIGKLCFNLDPKYVDPVVIAQRVIQGVYPGVTTSELDELAAQTSASFGTQHPDYSILAARISVSNLHKMTTDSFVEVTHQFHSYVHPKTGQPAPLVSDDTLEVVKKHGDVLDAAIKHERDFDLDYFGFKTLEKSYLLKMHGKVAERPQHMIMRVAVGIHGHDIASVLETYDMLSRRYFTHATPTLFNAGTPKPQMSSCFLLCMKDDSIDGIYDTLKQCAVISKYAGGIGLSVGNIRASQSYIRGTNGTSNGIVPMLRVFNNTARYVDQGGGKRKGSIATYLEPWHADIFAFLDLRKNHGNESDRARDLFYALWIPDLFMKRVQANENWTLMCPDECPGLVDCFGDEFEALYTSYERDGKGRETIKAQVLWFAILDSQVETGTPYMLYKDACNRKSNQQNLGTIKCSNLCTEIVQYTSKDECAVCNLASISLSKLVTPATDYDNGDDEALDAFTESTSTNGTKTPTPKGSFDFDMLFRVSKIVTKNLNRVIEANFYPVVEAHTSNMRHRPIGIGVQGLADAFQMLKIPFTSPRARKLNRDIFETIYFGACTASMELAKRDGAYESYPGSPVSKGQLQFDMWGVTPSKRWDWDGLKAQIATHGMRNSLLVAPMPTASTAQIMGNNESTEPYTSNMYNRRVLAGEFTVVNKHLLRELTSLGLWTPEVRNRIIADGGSVQNVASIPKVIREVYRTVWEIPQRAILDMACDRGAFIDQSQSLNVHIAEPNGSKLTSMHFYAWKKGLKTGMYYLRTRPKADAIQFTVKKEELMPASSPKAATSTAAPLTKGESNKENGHSEKASKKEEASQGEEDSYPLRPKTNTLPTEDDDVCLSCGA